MARQTEEELKDEDIEEDIEEDAVEDDFDEEDIEEDAVEDDFDEDIEEDAVEDETGLDDEPKIDPKSEKPRANKTISAMRKQLNELTSQNRAFQEEKQRQEMARIQQELNSAPVVKPTFESCGFDPDKFQLETEKWAKAQTQREQQVQQQAQQRQKADMLWQQAQNRYAVGKSLVKNKDYADVEATVETTLSKEQLGWLLVSTKQPNKIVYAAGKDEKLLNALKKAETPFEFAAMVGRIEASKDGTALKTPPAPEKRPESRGGGNAPASNAALDAAMKRAMQSGDLTEYRRLKAKKKA